jgi:DNA-binding NarL/FixJ family response regulator
MWDERTRTNGASCSELDDEPVRALAVLLADNHGAIRAGVRRALEADGFRIVAEASNAAEAIAAAVLRRPDVCLLSVHMPGDGIVAAERIRAALADTKIVMLTRSDRDEDLFGSLRAGADGYLLKTTPVERLPYAVRGVIQGQAALPRELTTRLIREFRDRGRRRRLPHAVSGDEIELTAREFEALEHLRKGESTAKIANSLQISEVTVRRHIATTLHKLGVSNRRGAIELLARTEQSELRAVASA